MRSHGLKKPLTAWPRVVISDCVVQERAATGGKITTLESLAVFLTLEQAQDRFGFDADRYGIDEGEAFSVARIFSKCASHHFPSKDTPLPDFAATDHAFLSYNSPQAGSIMAKVM